MWTNLTQRLYNCHPLFHSNFSKFHGYYFHESSKTLLSNPPFVSVPLVSHTLDQVPPFGEGTFLEGDYSGKK